METPNNNISSVAVKMQNDGGSHATGSGGAPTGPPYRLKKSSRLYIYSVISTVFYVVIYCSYQLVIASYENYDKIKVNLGRPWFPFSLLGSQGVDMSDLQWYYFIVALPPFVPFALGYLLLTRRARLRACRTYLPLDPPAAAAAERAPSPTFGEAAGASAETPARHLLVCRNVAGLQLLHLGVGLLIGFAVSGPPALFALLLVTLNYYVIAPLYRRTRSFALSMGIMWVTHVALLFANNYYSGYAFAYFGLPFLDSLFPILIQWTTQYNMSVLRMIAFNNDYWENLDYTVFGGAVSLAEKRARVISKHRRTCVPCALIREKQGQLYHTAATSLGDGGQNHFNASAGGLVEQQKEGLLCYKCRTECPRPLQEYQSLLSYLAYVYYPPLFMAGPMISYNAYVSYCHHPQESANRKHDYTKYGGRVVRSAVVLCVFMHYIHITAMMLTDQNRPAEEQNTIVRAARGNTKSPTTSTTTTTTTWLPDSAASRKPQIYELLTLPQKSIFILYSLGFLWLKFDVIWKSFRFFAMLDGIDPPEDMRRCFSNTVTIRDFWRDWHASFNLWIVRYMYIPMGGNRRKLLSIFPIFFFIAIWHDIEMRLLHWAVFICAAFIPEVLISQWFTTTKMPLIVRIRRNIRLYQLLRVIACVTEMTLLVFANIIGFTIGSRGFGENGLANFFSEITLIFLVLYLNFFFFSAILAVQDRDQEAYDNYCYKQKFGLQ
ncbi:hypothetical protein STCU_04685 [Strigomonas culicis]|uniref:Glycerol uptake protein n=1 Tax=Strigomonas culicis TaxID=28005 RepID=S9U2J6_9TRYP|nr:hypothetical protein STCU_07934 [Strigomonas culicis]EPY29180.1 hypothetical protein STCU_04685 [Strigomonas culicis]|eukprot:EPY23024.1 hypothetical protein STCU_07934 [Strigomonas culicis]